MTERPRFFDDLAGVAGGAAAGLGGLRAEGESMIRARVDEAIRKLDLVRREDLEAVQEMAATARAAQAALETRVAELEARLAGGGQGHSSPALPLSPAGPVGTQTAQGAPLPGSDEPGLDQPA